MRPILLGLTAAIALLLALPSTAQVALTDAERTALHAEIRGYLLENPEILVEIIALLEDRQKADAAVGDAALIAEHSAAIFEDGFSFVGGNPEGRFTIVEFVDYQCGYCRRSHPEMRDLIATDGDIRLIVKEMPILGPGSEQATRAAIATLISEGGGVYARLNDTLMRLDGPVTDASLDAALAETGLDPAVIRAGMQDEEVTRRIAETRALAQTLHISGTPTYVMDSRMVRGYLPQDEVRALIDELRAVN